MHQAPQSGTFKPVRGLRLKVLNLYAFFRNLYREALWNMEPLKCEPWNETFVETGTWNL